MCEFCVKHGEGKKWYLNVKNYSQDLLSDIKRRDYIKDHFFWVERVHNKYFNFLKTMPLHLPIIGPSIKAVVREIFIREHWSQIIPIEDVEKILNFTNSIIRVACVCRMATTGKEHRLCFLISLDPNKLGIADIIDTSFFKNPDVARFEKVDKCWALNFMKESEKVGMIHSVWTLHPPFIGIICNCQYSTGCIAMKMIKEITPMGFRAEYVAAADKEKCMGCKECMKVCQFGAIRFNKDSKKVGIDARKCFGCGVCRSVCKQNAIALHSRHSVPAARNLW